MNRSHKKNLSRKIRAASKQVARFKRNVALLEIEMGVTERMGLSDSMYMMSLFNKLGFANHELVGAIMTRDWRIAGLKSLKDAKLYPPMTKEDQARRMLRKSIDFGTRYGTRGKHILELNLTPSAVLPFPVLDYPANSDLMKKATTLQEKQMPVNFTIIVKNNIVETVLSHTGEHLLFNVIDLDVCKVEGTNPRLALEADQFYFTQSTEQIVPLEKLQNEL